MLCKIAHAGSSAAIERNRRLAIERYQDVIKALDKYEGGPLPAVLVPHCNDAIRKALRKDQRKAVKALKARLPADLKVAMDRYGWRFHEAKAEEFFEYMTLRRERKYPLTEVALRERLDVGIEWAPKNLPAHEQVRKAVIAGKAHIADLWRDDEKPKLEDEPQPVTRSELLKAHSGAGDGTASAVESKELEAGGMAQGQQSATSGDEAMPPTDPGDAMPQAP